MIKKITTYMLIMLLIPFYVFAGEGSIEPTITSPYAVLMEQSTKRVLFNKNMREKVKIASTTKILTAIVAIENGDITENITISKRAALTGGSRVGIKEGSEVVLNSLLYGMLLKSGNDCAVAIAEHIGGSVEKFVDMMNKKAYEIGAKDSHFTNPHGLDAEDNYSTAYDLAIITCYAKQNETLSKIMGTESITLNFGNNSKYLANTNRLLFTYEYCDGGKTGFTNIANRCLVVTAKKDDLEIVAVVLGSETTDKRFMDGKTLLKYGIENYSMEDLSDTINWYIDIPVYKGDIYSYIKKFKVDKKIPLKQGEKEKIYISQNILPKIEPPLIKGTYLGNIEIILGSEVLYTKNIYLEQDIKKNNIFDYMKRGLFSIFNLYKELEKI